MPQTLSEPLASITGHKPTFTAQFSVTLVDGSGAPVFQDAESFTFSDLKVAKAASRKIVANAIKLSGKSEGEE